MKRRDFLKGAVIAVPGMALVPNVGARQPLDIETTWIPFGRKDKSDPLGQCAYACAKTEYRGETYGVVHRYLWGERVDERAALLHAKGDLLKNLIELG